MFYISTNNMKNYLMANKSFVFYIAAFIALNILCFSGRAYAYREVFLNFCNTMSYPMQNLYYNDLSLQALVQ